MIFVRWQGRSEAAGLGHLKTKTRTLNFQLRTSNFEFEVGSSTVQGSSLFFWIIESYLPTLEAPRGQGNHHSFKRLIWLNQRLEA
jgi:hypothetical protein